MQWLICCECVSCIFSLCSRVKLLLFIISLTVHRKTNFLVNLYWDNKYSDSDSDSPAPASLKFLVSPAGPAKIVQLFVRVQLTSLLLITESVTARPCRPDRYRYGTGSARVAAATAGPGGRAVTLKKVRLKLITVWSWPQCQRRGPKPVYF